MKPSLFELRGLLRHWLLALQQSTRIPLREATLERDAAAQRGAAMHFPGVGVVVGLVACVLFALVALGLPDVPAASLAAALACTAATVLLTGAAHEEGLARVAEALARGATAEGAAALLEEPRLGTPGVLALLLAVSTKVVLIAVLAQTSAAALMAALFAAPVVSRWWPLLLARELPLPAAGTGTGARAPLVALTRLELQRAAAWCLLPLAALLLAGGIGLPLVALAFSGLAFLLMRAWLRSRLPLAHGDTLGACQQLCELGLYLGAALAVGY